MPANQLRPWFASMAYALICALRRIALQQTQFAKATCGTIRLKLLKIGALVRTSFRRIKFAMASSCPYQRDFALAPPPPYYPPPAYSPPAAYSPPPASYQSSRAYAAPGSTATSSITYTPRPGWTNAQGQYCREYKAAHGVGKRATERYGTACRDASGQWRIVN